ncbi:site-specific integrase [Lentilactobacillus hilgardii]|nr:site-specific integrase [Lentilactobacillus hilgardii]
MLKFSIQYSKNICQRTGHILKEDGFLFLNEQSGMPVYIQYPNRLFKKVESSCHIHIYPHLLRHYFATMARSLNLSPTDVMHWLGHSSLDMTDSYTRPTQQGSLKVINGMQDVLFKKDASTD